MRTALFLVLASIVLLMVGCTAAEIAATTTAVGGAAVALINELAPIVPPEMLAKLQATAQNIDGTVQAVQMAVGTIAEVIGTIRATTESNFETVRHAATELVAQVNQLPTHGDLLTHDAGVAMGSIGAARALSIAKHGYVGKQRPLTNGG